MFISEFDFYADNAEVKAPAGWKCSRWWPGTGSRAMVFAWRSRTPYRVWEPTWEGRTGAMRTQSPSRAIDVTVVGVHAKHGEGLPETLREAKAQWQKRDRRSKTMFVGDWNVDYLSTQDAVERVEEQEGHGELTSQRDRRD